MSDVWGNRIKICIFGESHGPAIGVVIDGLPAGLSIDIAQVAAEMARRAPGNSDLATPRKEADNVEILSGFYNGKTTGSALCGVIHNTNVRSGDYKDVLRPGHADWSALLKHKGYADMRGGGHFSGRLTAPLVFAGAVAKQILALHGVSVHGRITAIAGISDSSSTPDNKKFAILSKKAFPVIDESIAKDMEESILNAKLKGDSVGGVIEVAAFGVPGGLGDPFFRSVESVASSLFFSIPAVKGVEFGDGFEIAKLFGSEANDQMYTNKDVIMAKTNHNGGILGGITNGMPIIARLSIKPTPSISVPQNGISSVTMQETAIETRGRHDPCIVPRAVPVAEAALALAVLDCLPSGGIK